MTTVTIYSQTVIFDGGIFWGCEKLSTVEYYGFIEPVYQSNEECFYYGLCGSEDYRESCSPFSCNCNSLFSVVVPYNYEPNEFCKISVTKREENIATIVEGQCGNDCKWKFSKEFNLLTISGKGMMNDFINIEDIPAESKSESFLIVLRNHFMVKLTPS